MCNFLSIQNDEDEDDQEIYDLPPDQEGRLEGDDSVGEHIVPVCFIHAGQEGGGGGGGGGWGVHCCNVHITYTVL